MATYRLAAPALADLDTVADYYIVAAGADRAGALIASIVERFRLLSEHPRIGVARPELSPGLRSYAAPGTSYVIFYFPREYGVEVVRVLHGRRDLAPLFG